MAANQVTIGGLKELIQQDVKIELEIHNNKYNLKNELYNVNFIKDITDTPKGLIVNIRSRENYKNILQILGKYDIIKVKELDLSIEDLFLKII